METLTLAVLFLCGPVALIIGAETLKAIVGLFFPAVARATWPTIGEFVGVFFIVVPVTLCVVAIVLVGLSRVL